MRNQKRAGSIRNPKSAFRNAGYRQQARLRYSVS